MISDEKKAWAEALLLEKYKQLGRLPRKKDFDDVMCSQIKAYLGSWPHALRALGLKEAKPTTKKKRKRKSKSTGQTEERKA